MTKLLLTPTEAAELLGVSRSTIYELMNSGDIESVRIGRSRRIPSAALVTFVARLRGEGHAA
ncbi:DNA-binding protein, excisionase family [Frankia torreyi]|uniref:DNA-binding protein, excisionase family n=1 Tax=Frankia torreyi TaxID=1856 RepID=A0A0D8BDM2_9ACTN|nr:MULTISPECIES: helix-turn-helix domain-containing protein [Frankia]KJE21497.1 DNA-binding protein, excisionase family [Frankia torreyi]KQM03509.1 DNA-binding protein, excisionase family [Frankia sp. CpI1-P]